MTIKEFLLRVYNWGFVSHEKTDNNQQKIRNAEWNAIVEYIPYNTKFVDIGCGAGYSMEKAWLDRRCDCYGIDPCPGEHGVGRYDQLKDSLNIKQGYAEAVPYDDKSFDVVYSSHVLEHVKDEVKSLSEMRRILKDDGILIIGMPTATMAWVNFFTQLLFTTHQRIFNVLFKLVPGITTGNTPLVNMLIPYSHSYPRAKTIFYDIIHYRILNWRKLVEKEFYVERELRPAIYPYPEYRQLFKLRKNKRLSSSVFFICKKK